MAFISTKKTFFAAAASGDVAELKYGLDANKYDINMKNAAGETATHIAAKSGQLEALKFLLERKPDLEAINSEGNTPLLAANIGGEALTSQKIRAAVLLLEAGANPSAADAGNSTALTRTVYNMNLPVVKELLARGAEINTVLTKNGRTALHWAVDKEYGPILELLMAQPGLRLDIADTEGKTPQDLAKDKPRMLKIMEDAIKAGLPPPAAPKTEPVKTEAAPVPPPPANENKAEKNAESWVLMSDSTVAKTGTYPALGRKLTEIFNFETEERTLIAENLKTGAESLTAPESFSAVAKPTLEKAATELKKLGGKLPSVANDQALDQSHIARIGLKP